MQEEIIPGWPIRPGKDTCEKDIRATYVRLFYAQHLQNASSRFLVDKPTISIYESFVRRPLQLAIWCCWSQLSPVNCFVHLISFHLTWKFRS
jgi:hypothetical protein